MRINKPFVASLVAYAIVGSLFACGSTSQKTKKLADDLRGKGQGKTEPFKLDPAQLPGIYLVQTFVRTDDKGTVHAFLPDASEGKQLWKLSANTIEIIKPKVEPCGERSYLVEGNFLKLAATQRCAEDKLEVVDQRGTSFAIKTTPFVLQGQAASFDTFYVNQASEAAAGEAVYTWDVDLTSLPAWLQKFVQSEASESEVSSTRVAFKDALAGSTVALKGNLKETLSVADSERKILTFKNGKALTHWYDSSKEIGPVTCYVIAKNADADAIAAGFSWKLASLELSHSRRVKGKWTLAGHGTESEADNAQRKNDLQVRLEGAPEGFAMTCSKEKGPKPLTLEEVKAAFGPHVEFSK